MKGRPVNPDCLRVILWLETHTGDVKAIAAATKTREPYVHAVLRYMRDRDHPNLANYQPKGWQRTEIPSTEAILVSALRTRTPLEKAWIA